MIKTIVNNEEKEIEQIRLNNNKYVDYIDEKIGGGNKYEGNLPINIKFIGKGLQNYKIYGNTVNGESVGDRTANLFDGIVTNEIIQNDGGTSSNNSWRCSDFIRSDSTSITLSWESNSGYFQAKVAYYSSDKTFISVEDVGKNNTFQKSFVLPSGASVIRLAYSIAVNGNPANRENIMLNSGSTALPYEPYGYKVPITITNGTDTETTNIYLPEQIKKVGGEAEYIDFKEQKQYRVRKNLLQNTTTSSTINDVTFTVNDDGSVTCNGTATNLTFFSILMTINQGSYIVSGAPAGCNFGTPYVTIIRTISDGNYVPPSNNNNDFGEGVIISSDKNNNNDYLYKIRVAKGYTCDNLTFYPMIRKADIEDDTYEPYIENTELDITIPALPTLSGTNTLSVETTVQPSKVYIKENIDYKRIFIATRSIENNFDNPYTFKSIDIENSTLKNYRIYGNTVDGESVGDRTGNLFDGSWENKFIDTYGNTGYATDRVLSSYVTVIPNQTYSVKSNMRIRSVHSYNGTTHTQALIDNVSGLDGATFTIPSDSNSIRISLKKANNGVFTPDDIDWFMLNSGSTTLPYEPYGYLVPVTVTNGTDTETTTNIYLPEQIKMVGDETEYIDFGEQKQYRVRKNIFSGFIRGIRLNTGTSIEESNNNSYTTDYIPVEANMLYTYSGGSDRISVTLFAYDSLKAYIGRTTNVVRTTDIFLMSTDISGLYTTFRTNLTGNNNPIKYIRVTYVDAGDSLVNDENIMLNSGSTALPYEPYIENTELDVNLPTLPTFSGTNTLSVGTEVQPSKMYIKGHIKDII